MKKLCFAFMMLCFAFLLPVTAFAKGGGGCFLPGTQISTPSGPRKVEDLRPGDEVISLNMTSKMPEVSKVQYILSLYEPEYLIINEKLHVTPTHPMMTPSGKVVAGKLVLGSRLLTEKGTETVRSIRKISKMTQVYNLVNVVPNHNYYADGYLVHNKGGGGGGRGGGSVGGKSGGSTGGKSVSGGKSTTSVGKAPSSTTKTVQSQPKTVNGKTYSGKGYVVDDTYKPSFRGGYVPPAGSTVYYQSSSSMWDWFPLYYIMTHDGNQKAVVTQPDGKEQEVVEEGTDGMYIFNWVIVILLGVGLIGGVIWLVNKMTQPSYGY